MLIVLLVAAAIDAAAIVVLTEIAVRAGITFERAAIFTFLAGWSTMQALRALARLSRTP